MYESNLTEYDVVSGLLIILFAVSVIIALIFAVKDVRKR